MTDNTSTFTEEDIKYLKSIKIYIATPAYGEMVSAYFSRSIAQVFAIAATFEINVVFVVIGNESLVTRARNELVGSFLDTDATHLFFIDADISFDPYDVFKLPLHRKDVVAAAYPTKGLAWNRVVGAKTADEARDASVNYVINLPKELTAKTKKNGMLDVKLHDGLLEVLDAGTGFMLISRAAIEDMIKAYKDDIAYVTDSAVVDDDGNIKKIKAHRHAIFDTSIELSTNRYLSEDYTFCRRWQNLGGKIWIDPAVVLNHHGTYTYRGYPLTRPKEIP
jgi:hypothetical protein